MILARMYLKKELAFQGYITFPGSVLSSISLVYSALADLYNFKALLVNLNFMRMKDSYLNFQAAKLYGGN